MSKFDVILLFIFALATSALGANFYLAVNGLAQFDVGAWTFLTALCAGEIVMFALKRIAEAKAGTAKGKHLKKGTTHEETD